ncbi:PREDICTED: leucine-rich repeat receptor-like serine/threonine-protein kinase At2g14510 [Tarenaya hassleriana]|uniref:leucine-rich repeat receptor-like serine/threonine-protein kinase At2g14510 n=1 Tax=Tarenaya hassleriana TaxID=28532 RepID=UPI00053C1715|nr:PREDICTED: leucine-rich repeat receptor-like serine/threonine-protein kinase At2g14510 [Tarenaya hassleriana]
MPHLRLLLLLSLLSSSLSQLSSPSAVLIDCGAFAPSVIDGRRWLPDEGFVFAGTPKNITAAGNLLDRTLTTVRSFPLTGGLRRKFCYVVGVSRGWKYMIRTTYFYGEVNGVNSPPVFDQIVDGTVWSVVNTTADYADGLASYYEGVFVAQGKSMSVCVAGNSYTTSDPFISALEIVRLDGSLYNSTDFTGFGLRLVARHAFGYSGSLIRSPDDQFDRFWEPYAFNSTIPNNRKVQASGFWNLPPPRIFNTGLKSTQLQPLKFIWPPTALPKSTYYIALYFAHDSDSLAEGSRIIDITLNGITYYRSLNVTPAGAVVFSTRWPLDGTTMLTLNPSRESTLGPLINGGEMFELIPLEGKALVRDATSLNAIKNSLQNPPVDWNGDPCLPRQYSWTGVTCSEGSRIRVVSLNLTNMGLSGSLAPEVANLTALSAIWLGNNSLSGPVPDLSSLKLLESLHLENNRFTGNIPPSFGEMQNLRELFLQNNNLTGQIPSNLLKKPGLDLRTSGNPLLALPPPPS